MTTLHEQAAEEAQGTTPPLFTASSRGNQARAYKLCADHVASSWIEALQRVARCSTFLENPEKAFLEIRRALFQAPLIADASFQTPGTIIVVPKRPVTLEEIDSEVEKILLSFLA